MKRKTLTKLSKAEKTKLRQDIEQCSDVRTVANNWGLDFGSVMKWVKTNRIRKGGTSSFSQSVFNILGDVKVDEENMEMPIETVPEKPIEVDNSVKKVAIERIRPFEEHLTSNDLWGTLFEAVNSNMSTEDIADLIGCAKQTVWKAFTKESTIKSYYEWCKLKGRPYIPFNKRDGENRRFELETVRKLDEKSDIIPKSVVKSSFDGDLMEVYDKNLNLSYKIDSNGRITINEDCECEVEVNIKLSGRNNECLELLQILADAIYKNAETVAKSREEYEIRKRIEALNAERVELLNRLQAIQS